MDLLRPEAILPHRKPFLFVDRFLAIEPTRWATGIREITVDDCTTGGNLAPILLAEMMAQVAGAAAMQEEEDGGAVLAAVDRFRVVRLPSPGEVVLIFMSASRRFGSMVKTRGIVRIGPHRAAAGEIVLRFTASSTH